MGLISLSSHIVFLTPFYCRRMKAQARYEEENVVDDLENDSEQDAKGKMLVRTWRMTQSKMQVRTKRKMMVMTQSKIDLLIYYA